MNAILNDLKNRILETSTLEGEFILRSGQQTDHYFDKYLFESSPNFLQQICQQLFYQFPQDYDILGGLELGGIPIATVLSQITQKPVIFVRKEAKQYGTCKLAEGIDYVDKKICIIEDVITTGGQVIESCQSLVDRGAIIHSIFCVILRDQNGRKNIEKCGLRLYNLFDFSEIV